jgi:regulator of replication initiation timing
MTLAEREHTNLILKVMSSQDLINKSIEQLASQVSSLVSKDEEIKLLRLENTKLREEHAMSKAALDQV